MIVDFLAQTMNINNNLSAMHTVLRKSPTLDDSANILEILYTS
jgi:hypothetical protein